MHLHSIMCGARVGLIAMAQVQIDDEVRDELRKYKAQYGMTYSDAIERLLEKSGWDDE